MCAFSDGAGWERGSLEGGRRGGSKAGEEMTVREGVWDCLEVEAGHTLRANMAGAVSALSRSKLTFNTIGPP